MTGLTIKISSKNNIKNVSVKFIYIIQKYPLFRFLPDATQQMFEILQDRTNAGFYLNVISDNILNQIAEYASAAGDLRIGIDLLRVSGNFAEADASRTIDKKHLTVALQNIGSISLKSTIKTLSQKEKVLLETIVESNPNDLIAGKLFRIFITKTSTSYASFNRILNKLEFLRPIDTKFTSDGVKGNARIIILRFDFEEIQKYLI
jgi:cell division control protein 6